MPARKRKADAVETPDRSASRRRSTRIGSSGKKSSYFEGSDSGDDLTPDEATTAKHKRGGAKQRRSLGSRKVAKEDEDEDAYDDEEQDRNAEPEDEEDEEFDEDAPPKVTFIPLPKMRGTGGVEYEDDRLHKNTLLFLKDLKANNKRTWLKSHDEEFRRSLKDWESYVETLTQKIIEVDETIPELPFKDVNFRIYRDIRFSKDPTPYKPHYSAAWSRTGRKGPYACYYVHAEPGKAFVGGGLWHPEADSVHRLRASIDERPRRWRRVLGDAAFGRAFLPGVKSGDEEAAVKAFAALNKGNALKTKPKNFVAEHRDIELLKLRNFTVSKKIPDTLLTSPDGQVEIAGIIGAMVGFVTHLNNIVMPDPGQDDDSDGD